MISAAISTSECKGRIAGQATGNCGCVQTADMNAFNPRDWPATNQLKVIYSALSHYFYKEERRPFWEDASLINWLPYVAGIVKGKNWACALSAVKAGKTSNACQFKRGRSQKQQRRRDDILKVSPEFRDEKLGSLIKETEEEDSVITWEVVPAEQTTNYFGCSTKKDFVKP